MNAKSKKICLYTGGTTVILIGIVYFLFFFGAFRPKQTAKLCIDADDTTDSVYTKLDKQANPVCMLGFKTLCVIFNYPGHVHTGCYEIPNGTSTIRVFKKLRKGQQSPVSLTIPSVRTLDNLATTLSKNLMLNKEEIMAAVSNNSYCNSLGYDTTTIACLFIPNTYEVYWNISLDDFMKRMVKENKAFWTEEKVAKAAEAGLTPNQAYTLASIVDEETANNAEKPMIAGLYLNRFHQEMPLQADPTIKFAWHDFTLTRIYEKLLKIDSPYNTYVNKGLPPGPIRIPSVAGINAVLNHAKHNFIYMCAKEDLSGTHNFAVTYEEHLANAKKYTDALNARGIGEHKN